MLFEQAASLVANRGYTNVRTFAGGIPAWAKAGYELDRSKALPEAKIPSVTVEEFRSQFSKVGVVDIRVPSLYKLGIYSKYMQAEIKQISLEHRKKYHHKIPLSKLPKDYNKITMERKVIIVDHNGKQSQLAGKFLANKGYKNIYYLKGGLMALTKK